jgi:hypothetical protein
MSGQKSKGAVGQCVGYRMPRDESIEDSSVSGAEVHDSIA